MLVWLSKFLGYYGIVYWQAEVWILKKQSIVSSAPVSLKPPSEEFTRKICRRAGSRRFREMLRWLHKRGFDRLEEDSDVCRHVGSVCRRNTIVRQSSLNFIFRPSCFTKLSFHHLHPIDGGAHRMSYVYRLRHRWKSTSYFSGKMICWKTHFSGRGLAFCVLAWRGIYIWHISEKVDMNSSEELHEVEAWRWSDAEIGHDGRNSTTYLIQLTNYRHILSAPRNPSLKSISVILKMTYDSAGCWLILRWSQKVLLRS